MSEAAAPAMEVKENHEGGEEKGIYEGDVKECDPPPSGGVTASLLQNLIFLNWVQYPPLPRVPDLSDPAKFLDSDTCSACHLYISVTGEAPLRFERHLSASYYVWDERNHKGNATRFCQPRFY